MLAALVVLAIPTGQASETMAGDFQLYAQPSICVSYNTDEPCRMSMEVSWQADDAADVCLRDAVEEPMLYCWENTREGSIEIDYANTGDVLYQLVDEASLGVLAETEIKVINRDLRSSRKRRRHVWSIL